MSVIYNVNKMIRIFKNRKDKEDPKVVEKFFKNLVKINCFQFYKEEDLNSFIKEFEFVEENTIIKSILNQIVDGGEFDPDSVPLWIYLNAARPELEDLNTNNKNSIDFFYNKALNYIKNNPAWIIISSFKSPMFYAIHGSTGTKIKFEGEKVLNSGFFSFERGNRVFTLTTTEKAPQVLEEFQKAIESVA